MRHYERFSLSGAKDKVDFFVSGSSYKTDGYVLSDDFKATPEEGGGLRENSDRTRNNFFAKVGYVPNDQWLLGATVSYVKGDYGVPASVINDSSDLFANKPKV